MKIRIFNSIQVPWESWWHLENLSYFQRCGKYHTEEQKERMKRNFEQFAFYDGMKQICDYDQGGAIGDPERSYEEGRWVSWSCEDMKKILNEADLPWKEGEPEERILA